MCGIAGLIDKSGQSISALVVARMTDALEHRGPDGGDIWLEDNVGLGHRRLSIIDLSVAGNQPMTSADGKHKLVFNGEIYNFRELKSELKGLGYTFKSNSDTEVVLYSIIEWGEQAFKRFNGMFALAIWNRETRELLIGRDRYGIKPCTSETMKIISALVRSKKL